MGSKVVVPLQWDAGLQIKGHCGPLVVLLFCLTQSRYIKKSTVCIGLAAFTQIHQPISISLFLWLQTLNLHYIIWHAD